MINLECKLCQSDVEIGPILDDYIRYLCPNCGTYDISGTMITMLETCELDKDASLVFLSTERKRDSNLIPMITSYNDNLIRR